MQRLTVHQPQVAALDGVLINLAKGSSQWPQHGLKTRRYARLRLAQPLGHQLPCEIDIHRIVEHYGDHRKPELRNGSYRFRPRHPEHAAFEWKSDKLFYFHRR